jgi:peptide/nickel transport system ATP-binding protein
MEPLAIHAIGTGKAERRDRAMAILESVGLQAHHFVRYPHELSGGQRQRVMIAMALALDPQLVIMDEPTTALDVVTQREIINELSELRARFGFAMIFITHDLSLLVELADEIAVMYAGSIVERAPASALYSAPRHPYTLGLLNSSPPLHGIRRELEGIPGSPPDLSEMVSGCSFHTRCPYKMEKCVTDVPPLLPMDDTGRVVACWLHSGDAGVVVPEPLGQPVAITPSSKFHSGLSPATSEVEAS